MAYRYIYLVGYWYMQQLYFSLNTLIIQRLVERSSDLIVVIGEWKMNKGELVATIAETRGITKVQAERALNIVLKNMADAMERGERVTLVGFGSFRVVERAAQKGRNPQTGQTITIPAHNVVKFKPGKRLCEKVQ